LQQKIQQQKQKKQESILAAQEKQLQLEKLKQKIEAEVVR
jgi:hypothetical protein